MTGDLSRITDHPDRSPRPGTHRYNPRTRFDYRSPPVHPISAGLTTLNSDCPPKLFSCEPYAQLGREVKRIPRSGTRRKPAQFPRIVNRKGWFPTTSEFVLAVGVTSVWRHLPTLNLSFGLCFVGPRCTAINLINTHYQPFWDHTLVVFTFPSTQPCQFRLFK
jgi:hypothetical protein